MSLIKCPECGKEVSDQSSQCIHCGYPLNQKKNTQCIINGQTYNLSFVLDEKYSLPYKVRDFIQITHCEISEAREIIEKIIAKNEIPKTLYIKSKSQSESNKPRCPKCGSTNIATGQRGYSLLTGFLGSNKTVNRCANCGYSWKPGK